MIITHKNLLIVLVVYVYNITKEQKSERVFSEKVPPVPARIFILQLKTEPITPLNNVYQGGILYKTTKLWSNCFQGFFYAQKQELKQNE